MVNLVEIRCQVFDCNKLFWDQNWEHVNTIFYLYSIEGKKICQQDELLPALKLTTLFYDAGVVTVHVL